MVKMMGIVVYVDKWRIGIVKKNMRKIRENGKK